MIVPPRSTATLSASAGTNPTRRDEHVQEIAAWPNGLAEIQPI